MRLHKFLWDPTWINNIGGVGTSEHAMLVCLLGREGGGVSGKEQTGNCTSFSPRRELAVPVASHMLTDIYAHRNPYNTDSLTPLQRQLRNLSFILSPSAQACASVLLPAYEVGFGLFCQFADTPL